MPVAGQVQDRYNSSLGAALLLMGAEKCCVGWVWRFSTEMRLLDKIDAGFLPLPEFERAVGALPLVTVDWVLLNPAGQMLLGQRRNAPARHWWFTPGGRVRKNESLESCL
jgi:hypothetical protein